MRAHADRSALRVRVRVPVPGFTLIELMIVVAVMAILAMLALPSFRDRIVRGQIVEAAKLADVAKAPVAAAWASAHKLPAHNAEAGLPAADRIVGNLVDSVTVEGGAVQLHFGNQASGAIQGKTLTWRAAVVDDAPMVPVAWICGNAAVPSPMAAYGVNRTDIAENLLPLNCRR